MFNELKDRIAAFFAELSLKKLLLISLIAVCILFPTFLAISNAIYTTVKSSEPEDTPTVIIYDLEGNELFRQTYSREYAANESLANIFLSIKDNMEKTSPITAEIATEKPIIAEIIEQKGVTKLTCYFSFTHGSSYCVDSNGQYYKIANTYSDFFLSSSFAELLYTDATPPLLLTADSQSIMPTTASWRYKAIDSSFKRATLIKTATDVITYDVSGGMSFAFEREPDKCAVVVQDGDKTVFSGTLEELETVTLDTSTELLISIDAEWLEGKGKLYYGKISYQFKVIIHNRAEFSINSTELAPDGFVVIKATNISNPSRLSLTFPDSAAAPNPYFIGKTAYVAIPYPHGYADKVYTINVSYGISAKSFDVSLEGSGEISKESISASLDALEVNKTIFTSKTNDKIFLGGSQLSPTELGYTAMSIFGDSALIGPEFYVSPFVGYEVSNGFGVDVRSSAGGRVCAVAENKMMGKYVVVDCGLGIKLWYFGLSETSVRIGDLVAAGDVLGTTGTLAFHLGEGFYLMASCTDSIIDPQLVFEKLT